MNILIVGEYSALSKHLKSGFKQLGHTAVVVSSGDSFKKISNEDDDIRYSTPEDIKILGRKIPLSHCLLNPFSNARLMYKVQKHKKIDLVIVINEVFVASSFWSSGVSFNHIKKLKCMGAKVIMCSCGSDPANHKHYSELKYWQAMFPNGIPQYSKRDEDKFINLLRFADMIIPSSYEYFYSIEKYVKEMNINTPYTNTIPVPITIEDAEINALDGRKIRIFHGVIREDAKGTKYFVEAMNRIAAEYPDRVEMIVDGRMPYDEYIKLIKSIDVLLDNTNAYDLGVNTDIGLAFGKVVLGGNEPEAEENMAIGHSPVINAKPDVDYLYEQLKDLVLHPGKIDQIKHASREFAVKNLDAKVIAQKYLDAVGL